MSLQKGMLLILYLLQIKCNEEVTRRVGSDISTNGFAGTVEMCFATGPIGLRKYSTFMRCVIDKVHFKKIWVWI